MSSSSSSSSSSSPLNQQTTSSSSSSSPSSRSSSIEDRTSALLQSIENRDPNQSEFLQAVQEIAHSLIPVFKKKAEYLEIFERMVEPDRAIQFRVVWRDDKGRIHTNRGFRVQYNNARGPYKGGLRFHPSVNLSIVKFLGLEQILKNSLTGLEIGGGKGGSDFNPRGKSDSEVMAFCQAFMTELSRYIGPRIDVPAGDIGVGAREIGFLYGQYKRLTSQFDGVLTGKSLLWGGSNIRPEATGYGIVYFTSHLLKHAEFDSFEDVTVLVSGSGNVAQHTVSKLLSLGAKVVTMSDSSGYVYEKDGFTREQWEHICYLKNEKRARLKEYTEHSSSAVYHDGEKPWGQKCDIALPCATQNEIDADDAKKLVDNGCKLVCEGANMPSTNDAVDILKKAGIVFGPAKAANAGGVAVSQLEMQQNASFTSWSAEQVDEKLKDIMKEIYNHCKQSAAEFDKPEDFQFGANVAGFKKVADSMIQQGAT